MLALGRVVVVQQQRRCRLSLELPGQPFYRPYIRISHNGFDSVAQVFQVCSTGESACYVDGIDGRDKIFGPFLV